MGPSAAWFYEDQPSPPPKQQLCVCVMSLLCMGVNASTDRSFGWRLGVLDGGHDLPTAGGERQQKFLTVVKY